MPLNSQVLRFVSSVDFFKHLCLWVNDSVSCWKGWALIMSPFTLVHEEHSVYEAQMLGGMSVCVGTASNMDISDGSILSVATCMFAHKRICVQAETNID